MSRKQTAAHGGNIYKKARELGISESELLDFSANISPLGIPQEVKKNMMDAVEGLVNYPDPDCTKLREAIAEFDKVETEQILCGNGGADLLFRYALALKPERVLLPVPAFVEYEESLKSVDAEIEYFYLEQDLKVKESILKAMKPEQDLLILCNPNNPTGLLVERELLYRILDKALTLNMQVLVDECFLEIYPQEERYTLKGDLNRYSNLTILKSFTKMYAIPGVRLGYALSGNKELLAGMKASGQAWSVSSIAQAAGVAALTQTDYRNRVIELVAKENQFMKEELAKLPVRLYESAVNYLFFRAEGIHDLEKCMEKHGIMIRSCGNYVNLDTDYYRVAVKGHEDNLRLLKALKKELNQPEEQEEDFLSSFLRKHGLRQNVDSSNQESNSVMPEACRSCTVEGCGGSAEEPAGANYVYYGTGRGKQNMAYGAVLRAAEAGYRVLIYSFVKTKVSMAYDTKEEVERTSVFRQIEGITLEESLTSKKYTFMLTEEEKEAFRKQNDEKLNDLMKMAADYDVLLLDEALYAVETGLLSEERLLYWMRRKPYHLELILTGRQPTEKILAMAEFSSEVKNGKSNWETGIKSRIGIE